ncbi:MAG: orotidine-5'-phosphate decarboxylase [Rhodospirillales bacterium]
MTPPSDRTIVALDTTDLDRALALARTLRGLVGAIKLGKEFFTANGPGGVRRLADVGLPVFLDLKYHDIPSTVGGAVRAALPLAPFMLTIHAAGGTAMMRAAAEAAAEAGERRPMVLAVTVLTSLVTADLATVGVFGTVRDQAVRLALLARDCGLDGAVCSAEEVVALRGACGADFTLVVPGIRPGWAAAGDQKRIVTPADAVALGADFLVIGRPIIAAPDPAAAARRIGDEIGALADAG